MILNFIIIAPSPVSSARILPEKALFEFWADPTLQWPPVTPKRAWLFSRRPEPVYFLRKSLVLQKKYFARKNRRLKAVRASPPVSLPVDGFRPATGTASGRPLREGAPAQRIRNGTASRGGAATRPRNLPHGAFRGCRHARKRNSPPRSVQHPGPSAPGPARPFWHPERRHGDPNGIHEPPPGASAVPGSLRASSGGAASRPSSDSSPCRAAGPSPPRAADTAPGRRLACG